jgi:pimeloyl-ACP methyl ester carboxylesterase
MARLASLLLLACVVVVAGCPRRSGTRVPVPSEPGAPALYAEDLDLTVPIDEETSATLGARLYGLDRLFTPSAPVIVFVPGGGRVSRLGTRPGDGDSLYDAPVDVTDSWARAVAGGGWLALSYDKRTCDFRDSELCRKNPTPDMDAEGPVALARDVDAACDAAAAAFEGRGYDGRIVLWAHGQGAQVALASQCAQRAAAVVLSAPIPRRVDEVMVDSLDYREQLHRKRGQKQASSDEGQELLRKADQLRNAAGSTRALFESMEQGRFAEDARVQGATLAFWKGWIELTARAEDDVKAARAPRLVVVGQWDLQYTPDDRKRLAAWGELEGVRYLKVEKADHHLLHEGVLERSTVDAVLRALGEVLGAPAAPAGS